MSDLHQSLLRLVRSGNDLSARQLCVLFSCRTVPRTVRHLADELNVAKPSITRAADKLADAGYSRRKEDPADRRSVLIELTATGRKFADAALT